MIVQNACPIEIRRALAHVRAMSSFGTDICKVSRSGPHGLFGGLPKLQSYGENESYT